MSGERMHNYLKKTQIIDCDNDVIIKQAKSLTRNVSSDKQKAIVLFYFVRDKIKYNPYSPGDKLEYNKASLVLERGHGFCYQKAILLVAFARASGIPARLHFATIRNYRISEEFLHRMFGSNIMPYHGYAELYIDNKWIAATPAYDKQLCKDNGFVPVEFDGIHDAKLQLNDIHDQPHIEYLADHGHYEDFPWDDIISAHINSMIKLGVDISEFSKRWVTNVSE